MNTMVMLSRCELHRRGMTELEFFLPSRDAQDGRDQMGVSDSSFSLCTFLRESPDVIDAVALRTAQWTVLDNPSRSLHRSQLAPRLNHTRQSGATPDQSPISRSHEISSKSIDLSTASAHLCRIQFVQNTVFDILSLFLSRPEAPAYFPLSRRPRTCRLRALRERAVPTRLFLGRISVR